MGHEQYEDILPLYAIGALDRHERQTMEAHLLTGCDSCHAALKDYHAVAGLLPYGQPAVPVPPMLRKEVIAAAFQSGPMAQETIAVTEPRRGIAQFLFSPATRQFFQTASMAAMIVLLAGTGFYAWTLHSRMATDTEQRRQAETTLQTALAKVNTLQQQVDRQEQTLTTMREQAGTAGAMETTLRDRDGELAQLRTQLSQAEKEVTTMRKVLSQRDEMLTFLRSAHVKVVSLAGLEGAKSAGAFLLYDQDSKKAFFYAFNMPPLPAGKTYQLWAIVDKPLSAGVFDTDAGNKGRLIVRSLPELSHANKFAVSMEPEGGRPQPTGTIYLAGQL